MILLNTFVVKYLIKVGRSKMAKKHLTSYVNAPLLIFINWSPFISKTLHILRNFCLISFYKKFCANYCCLMPCPNSIGPNYFDTSKMLWTRSKTTFFLLTFTFWTMFRTSGPVEASKIILHMYRVLRFSIINWKRSQSQILSKNLKKDH